MISLRVHNVIDYLIGVFLIVTPWVFGFSGVSEARSLFLWGGSALIAYSLFTRYEISLWKVISIKTHMALDAILGTIVALAPWLLGFRNQITGTQTSVHVVLGVAAILLAVFTKKQGSQMSRIVTSSYDRAA